LIEVSTIDEWSSRIILISTPCTKISACCQHIIILKLPKGWRKRTRPSCPIIRIHLSSSIHHICGIALVASTTTTSLEVW
jgi:hypothetical protein